MASGRDLGGLGEIVVSGRDSSGAGGGIVALGRDLGGLGERVGFGRDLGGLGGIVVSERDSGGVGGGIGRDSSRAGGGIEGFGRDLRRGGKIGSSGRVSASAGCVICFLDGILGPDCSAFLFLDRSRHGMQLPKTLLPRPAEALLRKEESGSFLMHVE